MLEFGQSALLLLSLLSNTEEVSVQPCSQGLSSHPGNEVGQHTKPLWAILSPLSVAYYYLRLISFITSTKSYTL